MTVNVNNGPITNDLGASLAHGGLPLADAALDPPLTPLAEAQLTAKTPATAGGKQRAMLLAPSDAGRGIEPYTVPNADPQGKINPFASTYPGAFDGNVMPEEALRAQYALGEDSVDRAALLEDVRAGTVRPDDIAKLRTLGLIDDRTAQELANVSLDILEAKGLEGLPKAIRFTSPGPFFFKLANDDTTTLGDFREAIGLTKENLPTLMADKYGLDEAQQAKVSAYMRQAEGLGINDGKEQLKALAQEELGLSDYDANYFASDIVYGIRDRFHNLTVDALDAGWNDATLKEMVNTGLLTVTDRFGNAVDLFSETEIDGELKKLINVKIKYNKDYEKGPNDNYYDDEGRLTIEAWNHDLSRPGEDLANTVVLFPAPYNTMTTRTGGDPVDLHQHQGPLWRYEMDDQGRTAHVKAELDLATRPEEQIRQQLEAEQGGPVDEEAVTAAYEAYKKQRGFGSFDGIEYIRYKDDQTPAGNQAAVKAGFQQDYYALPREERPDYFQRENRYNGGHLLPASVGGAGEGFNVTMQAEENNQDDVAHKERPLNHTYTTPEGNTIGVRESWHDLERMWKMLAAYKDEGATLNQLAELGFTIPEAVQQQYGPDEKIPFELNTFIRPWYEDDGHGEGATGHTREFARFTGTLLVDPKSDTVIGEQLMANYNVGYTDSRYQQKMDQLHRAGFLDDDGGFADDTDLTSFADPANPTNNAQSGELLPHTEGGGYLNETMPTVEEVTRFTGSEAFKAAWAPNFDPDQT